MQSLTEVDKEDLFILNINCKGKRTVGKANKGINVEKIIIGFSSVQFSSVAQSCPTLCDPMNHSRPGLPVHHQLPEFTQTHVH